MSDRDLDQSGYGFQRVRTYLGPTLGWVDELVQPTVHLDVARWRGSPYVVQPGDSLILIDVAAAAAVQLPDVVKWMQQPGYQPATGFDRSITVKDFGGNAANFNIVVSPFGQQSIDNIQQSLVISTARAVVKFIPLVDLTGWAVQTNVGGGGGSGGGDVFKAGNNTFTGINTFQGQTTVPTLPAADSTQNAASTAYVQSQGYITGAALLPYALIASPTFTGDPKAPTPGVGDNDTSIATTEFVQAALAAFSGGAPVNAEYITASLNATLLNERVLTNTASVTWDFSTPGQAKANSAAGGGNVSNSGTPTVGQYAKWVTAVTIQGVAPGTVLSDIGAQPAGNYQPLDGDLTALSALLGTNTIYYRSATDIWSPVTFSGLSFSGGVLTVTAGGGNVNNSGVPTVGQIAVWTDATHIQGRNVFTVSATAPVSPLVGDFWYDLSTGILATYINDGTSLQWIQVSPATPGGPGNFVQRDVTTTISAGYSLAPANLGNIASFTINPAAGNYQFGINNAAATWTAPTVDCAVDIMVTNGATAGAITFSGFTVGSVGDPLTTTNGSKFIVSIRRINGVSTYTQKALQ